MPRDAGRAGMGDEAEDRVAIGIMEGPEYQVREPALQGSGAKWREDAGEPMGRSWLAAGD